MLRVGATPSSSEPGAETGPGRSRAPQAARQLEVSEQQPALLRPESHETPPPLKPAASRSHSRTNSAGSSASAPNSRQHQRLQSAPSFSARRPNAPSLPLPPPSTPGHEGRQSHHGMGLTGDGRRGGTSPRRAAERDASPFARSPAADTTPKSATQSRFGFLASSVTAFTSRMTSPTQTAAPTRTIRSATTDDHYYDDDEYDELCNLDIEAALFPASTTSSLSGPLEGGGGGGDRGPDDAFSPAAYKNLRANATGLLRRMQVAHRRGAAALRAVRAEREAQAEEVEETALRARNFRAQLEAMAARADAQEEAVRRLAAELEGERRRRKRLEGMRLRERRETIFRVGGCEEEEGEGEGGLVVGEGLGEEEEEEEDERRRWRASRSTVKSEPSVDTDADSVESESIFSRSRSPAAMTCATESESLDVAPSPQPRTTPLPLPLPLSLPPPPLPSSTTKLKQQMVPPPQQLTAFQRLVKGISSIKEEGADGAGGEEGCRNCRGRDASVAWDTVSLLRDENIALKQRVAHLDVVVEGALDVVNGIKV
ncbi:hypothetical protein F4802DRAFT_528113 [Xylaria palmicola]|nr:hypothetical protein F4802DRAFT_528113 [Xylaria palmicola]